VGIDDGEIGIQDRLITSFLQLAHAGASSP